MATLTVWKFPTADGAERAEHTLVDLHKQGAIEVDDAAIVSYPDGAKKPRTKQLQSMAWAGSLGGAFWGLLFGLIFFVPLLGVAIGAGAGALAGSLTHVGIDEDFIKKVRAEITPGTSALFVMSSNAAMDRVHAAFAGQPMYLLESNLSAEQEAKLRDVFA